MYLNMATICRPTYVYSVLRFLPYTRNHLWNDCFNICADSVLQVLQIAYFSYVFVKQSVLDVPPEEKIKNCQIRASVTAGLMDDFHLQTLPVSLRSSKQRRMLFTCGGLLLDSLPNLRWTLTNDFISANYKTHCAFSLSVNIINSMQRHQRQT
jgi:hypothetical protein